MGGGLAAVSSHGLFPPPSGRGEGGGELEVEVEIGVSGGGSSDKGTNPFRPASRPHD